MAVAAFGARLASVLETAMPTTANPQELAPLRLPLSAGAKELLWRFHEAVERAQAVGGTMEQVRAYASKAAEQAARISGVLTLWADLDAPEVTPQTMGWGVALAQFYLGEARRLAEAGAISAETERAEALRKWLLDTWPQSEVLPSDILKHGPNAMRERAKLTAPLGMLVKSGWLVALPEGAEVRGVSRKEAYRIVRPSHVL